MGVVIQELPSDFTRTVQAYGDVGSNALQTVAGGIAQAAETRGIAALSDAFESFQATGFLGGPDTIPEQRTIGTPAGFPDPSVFMDVVMMERPAGLPDPSLSMGAVEAERPAGLPDPSLSMGAVEAERQPFSDIVPMQDVLKNLTDPKFNAAAGLADFAQNVLGLQTLGGDAQLANIDLQNKLQQQQQSLQAGMVSSLRAPSR